MPSDFPAAWSRLRTVLCHDWLTGMRGGERVLELLCQGFPKAPVYTLIHNAKAISETINGHPVRTSFLQGVPGIFEQYRYYLPLFPAAVAAMKPPEADLLISTSHCAAKAIQPHAETKHLCYCFTPMRYAWTFYEEYFGGNPLKKALLKPTLNALRRWDRSTCARVHRFVAISEHVRARIRRFYQREADLVYPPVNTAFYTPGPAGHDGFDLIVSALVPYKRLDLAVQAYTRLGYPLKVVGAGTELETLRFLAGDNVEFLGWIPDDRVRELYRRCRMLIFPGEEDFGIVPVEAQSCGKPVVAYGQGGATETVVPGKTGVFFTAQTQASLLQAVEQAAATKWDAAEIRRNAERFSTQSFIHGLDRSIQACLAGP